MRRPTPLPPPPPRGDATSAAAPRATSSVGLAPEFDGRPGDDRTAGEVIALTTPARADDAASRTSGDESIGWRDVWGAARARRKALRAEVRRFTARQRRRRMAWIGAAASIVVLALATLGAAYSPLFAVETITVVGADQLDEAEMQSALADQLGTPMPLVDESAVKAALIAFPLVESYTLEARPPHELLVRIVERTPIGVIETRAGFSVVDSAGVALSTTAAAPAGLPVIEIRGGVGSDAFAAAGQVMHSLPDAVRAQVTSVEASTPDDVTLKLGATGTRVVWGSASDSAKKAVVLQKAMAAKPPATVNVYDVSSPSAVVIR